MSSGAKSLSGGPVNTAKTSAAGDFSSAMEGAAAGAAAGAALGAGAALAAGLGNAASGDAAQSSGEENATAAEEASEKEPTEEEKAAAAKAEEDRIAKLQDSYIVHTAMILCSHAVHESYLVVPVDHGVYVQGMPQLNIADSKPEINVRSFGICNSPENPDVKANAQKIVDQVKEEREKSKGFFDRVMDLFSKAPAIEADDDLIKKCVGKCTPVITMEWIDGKEDVLIDDKATMLGKCKLTCTYGGEIKLHTSGQKG